MSRFLILTAAGSSTRMGGSVKKEFLTINRTEAGRITVISAALYAFLATHLFTSIIITIPKNGEAEARRVLAEDRRIAELLAMDHAVLSFAEGGKTRQESVRAGIEHLAKLVPHQKPANGKDADIVLIHDGARPWVTDETIKRVIAETEKRGAAVPGIPSIDTQKEIDDNGRIVRHLVRSRIMSVQTPQGFRFDGIREAHAKAAEDGQNYTDDTEIWGRYAGDVYVCEGDRNNRKITYQGDL